MFILKCIHGTTDWKGLSERVEGGPLNVTVIKERWPDIEMILI